MKKKIISLALIISGCILGISWNTKGLCIGDIIFSKIGLNSWSNGTTGTHYPAVLGVFMILSGLVLFSSVLKEKSRPKFWMSILIAAILINLLLFII